MACPYVSLNHVWTKYLQKKYRIFLAIWHDIVKGKIIIVLDIKIVVIQYIPFLPVVC